MQVVVKFSKYISRCWPISIILQNDIQPISGLWQRCHDDCDPVCQLMFYVLFVSLSRVYHLSFPPLPVKSFCSSTIWCVTKEEQFYFFIGVQESEFSVCLMLLNILRLKESAWISQCRLTPSVHLQIINVTWLLFLPFDIFGTWLLQLQEVKFCHNQSFFPPLTGYNHNMLRTSRSFVDCSLEQNSRVSEVKSYSFSP